MADSPRSVPPSEPPALREAAQAVADYPWGLHLAGTANEHEAIQLIEALRAALRPPSEPPALDALTRAIEHAYASHDLHRIEHPEHTGTCRRERPHSHVLAHSILAALRPPAEDQE